MTSYHGALGQTTQVYKNGGHQHGQDHRQRLESDLQHLERKWLLLYQHPKFQVDAAETLVRLKMAKSSKQKSTCETSKKKPASQPSPLRSMNPIVPSVDSKTASSSSTLNDDVSKHLSLKMSLAYKEQLKSISTSLNKTLEEIGKEHNSLTLFFETEIVKLRERMGLQVGQNVRSLLKSRAKAANPNVCMNGKVVEEVRGPSSKNRRKRKIPKTEVECPSKKKCK